VAGLADVRISVIGAGSAVFSLGLVRDLCLTKSLYGSTVSFMDINEERLKVVYSLAQRYANEMKADFKFEKTAYRRESLKNANFVINTALTVSYQRAEAQRLMAEKYGYRRGCFPLCHDEAIYINFYQFKLFEAIINDMQDLCPDAWCIQSANPVFAGCTLLTRTSKVKIVGLCHGFHGGVDNMLGVLGLDWANVTAQAPGINHFIWLTHFLHKGEDAYPILDEWIEKKAQQYWDSVFLLSDGMGPKAVDLYRMFGLFPIGDTCTPGGGSWPWWYHVDEATEKRWKENPDDWWGCYYRHYQDLMEDMFQVAADPSVPVTSFFPPEKSFETNVSIIEALLNIRPGLFQVNIPNHGAIPSLAEDVVVEIPAFVSGHGIHGLHVSDFPKALTLQLKDRVNAMERELEAYIAGDRKILLQLLLSDPWTKKRDQAERVLDEILSLPFNSEMAQHYK
jgi:alpha-galactosidase